MSWWWFSCWVASRGGEALSGEAVGVPGGKVLGNRHYELHYDANSFISCCDVELSMISI